jgi:predicted DNA-binding transcriptional regulator AlpA
MSALPSTGFLRLKNIIGDKKAEPPVPALIPISKSVWWDGVRTGRFPKPVKIGRSTCWKVEDIRALIENVSNAV